MSAAIWTDSYRTAQQARDDGKIVTLTSAGWKIESAAGVAAEIAAGTRTVTIELTADEYRVLRAAVDVALNVGPQDLPDDVDAGVADELWQKIVGRPASFHPFPAPSTTFAS